MARCVLLFLLGLVLSSTALSFSNNNNKRCAGGKRCVTPHQYEYVPPPPEIPEVEFVPPTIGASIAVGDAPKGYPAEEYFYIVGGSLIEPELWPNYQSSYTRTPGYDNLRVSDGLYVYDIDITSRFIGSPDDEWGRWATLNIPRAFHVSRYADGFIWVWGGGSAEIERYDIQNNQWNLIAVEGAKPVNKYGSASQVIDGTWYVFGGIQDKPASGILSNRLWAFDFEELTWTNVQYALGPEPADRVGATMNQWYDETTQKLYLVVFGGTDNNGTAFNDLWYLDLDTFEWEEQITAVRPEGRWNHAAVVVNDTLYVTLGDAENSKDVWVWDFEDEEWTVQTKASYHTTPAPRSGFTYVTNGEIIVFFSGLARDEENSLVSETDELSGDIFVTRISPDTRWSWRHECYPGFVYEHPHCVRYEEEEECDDCEACADYSEQRRTYVGRLREKLIEGDYSGHLRQCPAFWKQGLDYPIADK